MAHFQFVVSGQVLDLLSPTKGIADGLNVNSAEFEFRSPEWSECTEKWAHFMNPKHNDGKPYNWNLIGDEISPSRGLNLPEGIWEVFVHGSVIVNDEVIKRYVTESAMIQILPSGIVDDEPLGPIDVSVAEQVSAKAQSAYNARITAATAAVDDNAGTPSVEVAITGENGTKSLDFSFHNLKGNSIEDLKIIDGGEDDGLLTIELSDGTEVTYDGLKEARAEFEEKLDNLVEDVDYTDGVFTKTINGLESTVFTTDTTPTEGSTNPITSDAVYDLAESKQDQLTFDLVPTEDSGNPVLSSGIYSAFQEVNTYVENKIEEAENNLDSGTIKVSGATGQHFYIYPPDPSLAYPGRIMEDTSNIYLSAYYLIESGRTYEISATGNKMRYGLYDSIDYGTYPKSQMCYDHDSAPTETYSITNTVGAQYLVVTYNLGNSSADIYVGKRTHSEESIAELNKVKSQLIYPVHTGTQADVQEKIVTVQPGYFGPSSLSLGTMLLLDIPYGNTANGMTLKLGDFPAYPVSFNSPFEGNNVYFPSADTNCLLLVLRHYWVYVGEGVSFEERLYWYVIGGVYKFYNPSRKHHELSVSDWDDNVYSLSFQIDSAYDESKYMLDISPGLSDRQAYDAAGITYTVQNGRIVFSCTTTPVTDIDVYFTYIRCTS